MKRRQHNALEVVQVTFLVKAFSLLYQAMHSLVLACLRIDVATRLVLPISQEDPRCFSQKYPHQVEGTQGLS